VTYPGEQDYAWITLETPAEYPHDRQCEVAARERGQLRWPDWKSCRCKDRRAGRSQLIPERPVNWPWLTGRAS
jgi:hypothetical protein